MGFCYQFYHKLKLNKDAESFRRTYGSMRKKAMKKFVKDLEQELVKKLTPILQHHHYCYQ